MSRRLGDTEVMGGKAYYGGLDAVQVVVFISVIWQKNEVVTGVTECTSIRLARCHCCTFFTVICLQRSELAMDADLLL